MIPGLNLEGATSLTFDDLAVFLLILLLSYISYLLARWLLRVATTRLVNRANAPLAEQMRKYNVLDSLALLAPVFVISIAAPWVRLLLPFSATLVVQARNVFFVVALALVVYRLLQAFEDYLVLQRGKEATESLQTIFRWLRVLTVGLALVLGLGALANVQITWLLAAIGLLATAGSIVFGDQIYNAFSQVVIKGQNLVAVGDWLEIPALQINGEVKQINNVVIIVQNWDNTLATVPPRYLVTNSFRNWQHMHRSGRRRVMRTLHIDATSVRRADPALVAAVRADAEVAAALDGLRLPAEALQANDRLTDAALYRHYLMGYLQMHPWVDTESVWRVHNEDLIGGGLPLVILAYLKVTQDVAYRLLDAQIYEHAVALAPHFGLRIYQPPTGDDLHRFAGSPHPEA